jgi:hypothetical protein
LTSLKKLAQAYVASSSATTATTTTTTPPTTTAKINVLWHRHQGADPVRDGLRGQPTAVEAVDVDGVDLPAVARKDNLALSW